MGDTRRLLSKLDEAIRIVQKQRRGDSSDAVRLAEQLRPRFGAGKPFAIQIGAIRHVVQPDQVRISKSRIDLGSAQISLMSVTDCVHDEQDGDPVYGPGIWDNDNTIVPVQVV